MAASNPGMELVNAVERFTLHRIEQDLALLIDARDEADTPEGVAACDQAIAEYMQRSITKADSIIGLILHDEARIATCKAEEKRIAEFRRGLEDRVGRVRNATQYALEAAGKKSVEGRTGKISIRPNGGKQALVIDDEKALPVQYTPVTVTYQVDREMVRKDLEDGKEIPGAHLAERGRHLQIT